MQGTPRPFPYPQRNYRYPPPNQWRAGPPAHTRPRSFRPSYHNNSNYGQESPNMGFNNQEHWCETCDRGFCTETLLLNHKKEHQKCNIDGCQFIAHPKIITKHIQMQHSTGLYKKIANLNNPEEIQKWREERKKKYPTKENIEKKMAASKEKIERGEKMGLDRRNNRHQFNNKKDFHSGQKRRHNGNENQPRFKQGKFHNHKQSADNEIKNDTNINNNLEKTTKIENTESKKLHDKRKSYKILPEVEEKRRLKPFTGISCIIEDPIVDDTTEFNDFIDDTDENHEMVTEIKEPAICSILSSLCDYGSSDEDVVEENTTSTNKPNIKVVDKRNEQVILNTSNGKLIPTEFTGNPHVKNADKLNVSDNKPKEVKVVKTEMANKVIEIIEREGEPEENISIPKESINTTAINDSESKVQSDDDSGPDEVKLDKTEIHNSDSKVMQNKTTAVCKKTEFVKKTQFRKPKSRLPSTLLQKLLSKEMQHERNVVLQCVRYIKNNNYFDKSNV